MFGDGMPFLFIALTHLLRSLPPTQDFYGVARCGDFFRFVQTFAIFMNHFSRSFNCCNDLKHHLLTSDEMNNLNQQWSPLQQMYIHFNIYNMLWLNNTVSWIKDVFHWINIIVCWLDNSVRWIERKFHGINNIIHWINIIDRCINRTFHWNVNKVHWIKHKLL